MSNFAFDALKKLKELLDRDIINSDEYASERSKLLAVLVQPPTTHENTSASTMSYPLATFASRPSQDCQVSDSDDEAPSLVDDDSDDSDNESTVYGNMCIVVR